MEDRLHLIELVDAAGDESAPSTVVTVLFDDHGYRDLLVSHTTTVDADGVALAADDPFFGSGETGIVKSWITAKRPVEFHLYQNGGHGFGLGNPGRTSTGWFPQFMLWLEVNGMLKP